MFSVHARSRNGEDPATLIRPSELPIYDEPKAANEFEYYERPAGKLEESVGEVRRAVTGFVSQYKETYDYAQHVIETGKAHSAGTLDYLQDETNLVPRATAITVGGLTGLLVAAIRRRGLFKRLLYTGVGLAVPTSVCYPQQTAAYGRWSFDESQKYGVVAYNFLVGAKPDDDAKPSPAEAAKTPAVKKEAVKPLPPAAAAPPPPPPPSPPAPAVAPPAEPVKVIAPVVPDPGQSNPEDADLYTTRSG